MRITGGEGLDVIMDALGPTSFRKDYRLLRPGGRLIMYGLSEVQTGRQAQHPGGAAEPGADAAGDDAVVEEPRRDEREQGRLRPQHAQLVGPRGCSTASPSRCCADLEEGELKPVVAEAFPFDRAADAHRFIAERRNIGKVVLFPSERAPLARTSSRARHRRQRDRARGWSQGGFPLLRRLPGHLGSDRPTCPRAGELVAGNVRRRHATSSADSCDQGRSTAVPPLTRSGSLRSGMSRTMTVALRPGTAPTPAGRARRPQAIAAVIARRSRGSPVAIVLARHIGAVIDVASP